MLLGSSPAHGDPFLQSLGYLPRAGTGEALWYRARLMFHLLSSFHLVRTLPTCLSFTALVLMELLQVWAKLDQWTTDQSVPAALAVAAKLSRLWLLSSMPNSRSLGVRAAIPSRWRRNVC